MPELPDVENYKRYLDRTALHKRIAGVRVNSAKALDGLSGSDLRRRVEGRTMQRTRRHGKFLFAELDDGAWLTFHFGMTGRLQYFKKMEDDPKHDRVRFDFDNGYHLAFDDMRIIGRIGMTEDADRHIEKQRLGPDALDRQVNVTRFREALSRKHGTIKSALMDQSLFAGIGNVYADEILFQARIAPQTPVEALATAELSRLHKAVGKVLRTAIDSGAGSEEITDRIPSSYLLPHRHAGASCPRCGGKLRNAKIAGRTSWFCPACQPRKRK